MLKGRNILRDSLCFFALILLIKHNAKQQYIKHASTKRIVKHVARKSLHKITDAVSDTFTKLGKATRRKKRNAKADEDKKTFSNSTETLIKQLDTAENRLLNDDALDTNTKDTIKKEIKETRSQVQHMQKEFAKEPEDGRFLNGPLGSTAQVVHERSLHNKLLVATNKTGSLLASVANELRGQDKKIDPATSVEQGLKNNNKIIALLA